VEGKALPHREADGSVLWDGHIGDITHHKSMESALASAARLDRLTNLPNRQLFVERLNRAIRLRRESSHHQFAVLFLDFDRFKIVNDSLGHEAGDRLLVEAANRIRNCVRPHDSVSYVADGDTAARFGGDEFVVLVTSLSCAADAETVAARLLESLSQPYQVGTYRVVSSASIGIVIGDPRYERAEEVLRDADTAMYEAKAAGKGRYVVFDAKMQDRVRRRMELEFDLRKAIAEQQLTLHYQPIVSLETGSVQRVESLVRWEHPTLGPVGPSEFVPVAEECDLIVPLGDWVLRESCRQLVRWWRTVGRLRIPSVSVNLSRQQLLIPDLVPRICGFAAEAGVEPNCVHLEITESSVMRDVAEARKVLYALKSAGFKLDLDDFGTGHSSLACLHEFPLDVLKIDRSFVMNLSQTRDFTSFFVAITSLAKSLGVQVVAEGVETAEQVEILRSLECQFAQGYFFGRPAPAHEVFR
jgi:diguanylate cyclase (GGDEF)-like protein